MIVIMFLLMILMTSAIIVFIACDMVNNKVMALVAWLVILISLISDFFRR